MCCESAQAGVWFFYLIKIFLLVNFSGAWKCLLICIIENAFHFKVVVNFLVLALTMFQQKEKTDNASILV